MAAPWCKPDANLTFEEVPHVYRWQGRVVPSVTTVLDAVLGNGYKSNAMRHGMERGKAVHLATQYWDEKRLDMATVDPSIRPYLTAYLRFLEDAEPEISAIEHRIYHPALEYAGTLDRVMTIGSESGVLDIKSGSAPVYTGPQLAAYCLALKIPRLLRWALVLLEDGTYRLNRYNDPTDLDAFQAALAIYRWKERTR